MLIFLNCQYCYFYITSNPGELQPKTDPDRFVDLAEVLECYDQSLAARFYISSAFFMTVLSLGTERHAELLQQCMNNEVYIHFILKPCFKKKVKALEAADGWCSL